jgi:hypothetical protein
VNERNLARESFYASKRKLNLKSNKMRRKNDKLPSVRLKCNV